MTRIVYPIPEAPREPMSKAEFERRQAVLVQRYPTMFDRMMHEHALQIEPGWLPLIELLCEEVHRLLPPGPREAFHWNQIKEKFGGLRAYFEGGPIYLDILGQGSVLMPDKAHRSSLTQGQIEAIQALVTDAEKLSCRMCQYCGSRGEGRNLGGLIATLCDVCATRDAHPLG